MGAKCNLHSPPSPIIMVHLKSSSNSNHLFIFQKGFIFGVGGSLLPSPLSFALVWPFLLVLSSYSYINVSLPINIFLTKAISLCNWSNLLMVAMMASSFITLPLLCLLPIAFTFSFASYSLLKRLLSFLTFLAFFPHIGRIPFKN